MGYFDPLESVDAGFKISPVGVFFAYEELSEVTGCDAFTEHAMSFPKLFFGIVGKVDKCRILQNR